VCQATESCVTCPFDCGPCAGRCGNGVCEYYAGETCATCPTDCGACPAGCGDGKCLAGETCKTCPLDCGPCAVVCGDGMCDVFQGESCLTCPADCGSCNNSKCGDGVCAGDEEACTCPADCGACSCGHTVCTQGAPLAWNCDPCVRQICDVDSYCCDTQWDATCVWNVTTLCRRSCHGGVCGDHVCNFDVGETCASCPQDCGPCVR
jgi:hypothetical protein